MSAVDPGGARRDDLIVLGSKTSTLELLGFLRSQGALPGHLVSLTPEQGRHHEVAGYLDLADAADAWGITLHRPRSYALTDPEDQALFAELSPAVALVMGWQRLVPPAVLSSLRVGAFGMHGSPEPLPRGRGRSPLNWSLLQGRTSFTTNLFRYDPGVDSGDIVGSVRFDINGWDDCASLHLKNRIAMTQLLERSLDAMLDGTVATRPQLAGVEPTYFPKRTAEDGRIAWLSMDVTSLHDHVRCQTRPFPGAFSHYDGAAEPFRIWQAVPFDTRLEFADPTPGTVCEVFHDGTFLVAVWDGTVRVLDHEAPSGTKLRPGARFTDHPR